MTPSQTFHKALLPPVESFRLNLEKVRLTLIADGFQSGSSGWLANKCIHMTGRYRDLFLSNATTTSY